MQSCAGLASGSGPWLLAVCSDPRPCALILDSVLEFCGEKGPQVLFTPLLSCLCTPPCSAWLHWSCPLQHLLTVCLLLGWHSVGTWGPLKAVQGLGTGCAWAAQAQAPLPHDTDISRRLQADQAWGHPVSSALEQLPQVCSFFSSWQEPVLCVLASQD